MKHYLFWLVIMLLNPIPDRDMVSPYKLRQTFLDVFLKDRRPEKYKCNA
jgi:hypothetical protein